MKKIRSNEDIREIGIALITAVMVVAIIGIMFTKDYLKLGICILGLIIVAYIVYKMVSKAKIYSRKSKK